MTAVEVEVDEAPTFWLVVESYLSEGWDRPTWIYEDADDVAYRGYFTSKEDAQGWIDTKKQRLCAEGRAKDDAALARKNGEAEQRYAEKFKQEQIRRREYDALITAGIEPSFERPAPRGPFKAQASKFDEQVYLKGLGKNWEVVEVEPHREEKT